MTSCPDDRALLELVDGELDPDCATAVVLHLAECPDCRLALGRDEAALTYALGGLADTGRWAATDAAAAEQTPAAPEPVGERDAACDTSPSTSWSPRLVSAALLATAAGLLATVVLLPDDVTPVAPAPLGERTAAGQSSDDPELSRLLARAEALRDEAATRSDPRDLVAAGALAAAEAREWTLGRDAARARVRDVMERFPGTPAAREARALLATDDGENTR